MCREGAVEQLDVHLEEVGSARLDGTGSGQDLWETLRPWASVPGDGQSSTAVFGK